jgi:outer membrane protein assembly factor BamA
MSSAPPTRPTSSAAERSTRDITIYARQYLMLTSRSSLAARLFVGSSVGNVPNFYYFGGLNTLRGFDFRSIVGTQAAFANFEFRFPLIDVLATPIIAFTQVRGDLFFDIGGAKFNNQPYTFFEGRTPRRRRGVVWLRTLVQLLGTRAALGFRGAPT